jgi:signal transduction histidine kinase
MSNTLLLFQKHLTLTLIAAVLLPLIALLGLQYHALARLEAASPAAQKMSLETRLHSIVDDMDRQYLADARRALAVSPAVINPKSEADDVSHFAGVRADGVLRFFVASLYTTPESKKRTKITTYDPATGIADGDVDSPLFWAIYAAAVYRINQMMSLKVVDPNAIEVDEKDPKFRIALRPIVDAESRIVGVAGIVVDQEHFRNTFLPQTLDAAVKAHFSAGELTGLRLVAWDESGASVVGGAASAEAAEVTIPLNFAYSKWRIGVVADGPTQAQLARRYFAVTLTISVLMTIVIAGAVWVTLRAASRELRLSEMKTDFVANVSHELRTPLASIRVFGELLKSGKVRDATKVREYGELIDTESTRLTQLINNILDFSRIESGRKTYTLEPVSVEALVRETVRSFAVRARQHGFEVTLDEPAAPMPTVNADPDAVVQAVVNLLDNAVKYSGTSKRVEVSVERRRGYVAISVTDRGIGIPIDEQKLIFNRFHRASSSLVHDVKGSGLGLALVKHVVESHGGFVTVNSRPGAGSTFTLHLPVDGKASTAADPVEVAQANATT